MHDAILADYTPKTKSKINSWLAGGYHEINRLQWLV